MTTKAQKPLPLGKLPDTLLSELIGVIPTASPDILVPPGIGRDSSVIKTPSMPLAITTDPVTFECDNHGEISVAINCNDVACQGAKPRWYSATLLLPPMITESEIKSIWQNLGDSLRENNLFSVGGHCEITESVTRPVLAAQVIGETICDQILDPQQATPGDVILLCRPVAIEGTAIIAQKRAKELSQHFSVRDITKMQKLTKTPGINIWPLVEKLLPNPDILGFHDPTEGGLVTALHEIADAAQCGLHLSLSEFPAYDETLALSEIYNFDPLGLLASGSLLIVCKETAVDKIISTLPNEKFFTLGHLSKKAKREMHIKGASKAIPRYHQDEIIRVL